LTLKNTLEIGDLAPTSQEFDCRDFANFAGRSLQQEAGEFASIAHFLLSAPGQRLRPPPGNADPVMPRPDWFVTTIATAFL
jgi:hypothetical protein